MTEENFMYLLGNLLHRLHHHRRRWFLRRLHRLPHLPHLPLTVDFHQHHRLLHSVLIIRRKKRR